jgi:hypothetical protein
LTRRDFITGSMLGAAGVGQGFSPASTRRGPGISPAPVVALRLTGTPGRVGAALALDEMARTASLLGRTVAVRDGPDAIAIDLDGGSLTVNNRPYFVTASAAARDQALARWRRGGTNTAKAAVEWHGRLTKYGAEQLNARFARRFRYEMDAAAWIAWMLVKIAVESRLRSEPVASGRYDGHKGAPLTFSADRRLIQPLCIVSAAGDLLGVAE